MLSIYHIKWTFVIATNYEYPILDNSKYEMCKYIVDQTL